jgi:hypothetical protein
MKFSEKVKRIIGNKYNSIDSSVLLKKESQPIKLVFNKNSPEHKQCISDLDIVGKIQKLKSKGI